MFNKLYFWINCKRLGPDIPLTHILLYSRRLGKWLCKKKFKHFGVNSEMRPFSYAVETNKISIGNNVVIRPDTRLFASPNGGDAVQIEIEDYVLIGSSVQIYVSDHKFLDISLPIFSQGHGTVKPVKLERGCWVGANSIILSGVTIGKNSVVAAGSIVTKDVPSFSVVAGNPAKIIKKIQ